MNARKQAKRSQREMMGREESIGFENRYLRWSGALGPETDTEEFLVQSTVFVSTEMDRTREAYLEYIESEIDNAENAEMEEAFDVGDLLFFAPRGTSVPPYWFDHFESKKRGAPRGGDPAPALNPGKLVRKLESGAMGCYWMLGVLEELLELARESIWSEADCRKMIRLLGQHPGNAIDDWRVAEILMASHAIHPVGQPFDVLFLDMDLDEYDGFVRCVRAKWRDLSGKDDPEKARQSLINIVQTEIDRVSALVAEHEANDGEEEARRIRARKGFVFSPEAESMRRSYLKHKGSLERGFEALRKLKRARKTERETEGMPAVPGKDISPHNYYGQPASWWRDEGGVAGRRKEGGMQDGGRRAEDGGWESGQKTQVGGWKTEKGRGNSEEHGGAGDHPSGDGRGLETSAHREELDGGGDCNSERVGPVLGAKERGWNSVVVEELDLVACAGYLPERCAGAAGEREDVAEGAAEGGIEASESLRSEVEDCAAGDLELNADRGSDGQVGREELVEAGDLGREDGGVVDCERPTIGAPDGGGSVVEIMGACGCTSATIGDVCATNEPNLPDDVCIAQIEESLDVLTNSGDFSGLDNEQTKPISESKPNGEGDRPEAGETRDETKPVVKHLTKRQRRELRKQMWRRESDRSRAESEERLRRPMGGARTEIVAGREETRVVAGEPVSSGDARGP